MRFLAFLAGNRRWIGGIFAGIAVCIAVFTAIAKHDDRIRNEARAPLLEQLRQQTAAIEAQKSAAEKRYAELVDEKKRLDAEWQAYIRKEQDESDKLVRAARAFNADTAGVRYHDPGASRSGPSCGSPEAGAQAGAGVPAGSTAPGELSGDATAFLREEALRADLAAIYAQKAREVALKCLSE